MANQFRIAEDGVALARAIAPETIAAATRAGERWLAEALNQGVSAASKDADAVGRTLNPQSFDWVDRMIKHSSWRTDQEVMYLGFRPLIEKEKYYVRSLDFVGVRARKPSEISVAPGPTDDGGLNVQRFGGTEFHFLKRPDLSFNAIETLRSSAPIKTSDFSDVFKASLTTDSRVLMQRVISENPDWSDARYTGSLPLTKDQLNTLLDDGVTARKLTETLLPDAKDTLRLQLQVLSAGRLTEFNFGRAQAGDMTRRFNPTHDNWMNDTGWVSEVQVRAAEPSTGFAHPPSPDGNKPPRWDQQTIQRALSADAFLPFQNMAPEFFRVRRP